MRGDSLSERSAKLGPQRQPVLGGLNSFWFERLKAHKSYHGVFREMEQVEKELDEQIANAKLLGAQSNRFMSQISGAAKRIVPRRGRQVETYIK